MVIKDGNCSCQRKGGVHIKLYTVPEIARMLRISKTTAYELVYTGQIKAVKVSPKGRSLRVTDSALEAYLQQGKGGVG